MKGRTKMVVLKKKDLWRIVHEELDFFFAGGEAGGMARCFLGTCGKPFKKKTKNHYFCKVAHYQAWIREIAMGHIMGKTQRRD